MSPLEYQIPLIIYTFIAEHPFFYGNLIGGGVVYMCFWAMYKLSPIRGFITMAYTPIKEKEPEGFTK